MHCIAMAVVLALAFVGIAHAQTSGCMPTNCPPPKCEGGVCR